jgi:hypothetical protein
MCALNNLQAYRQLLQDLGRGGLMLETQSLEADPQLMNPVNGDFYWAGTPSIITGAGDYRLMPNSPAIDGGTNVDLPADTKDIANNPVQGIPDLGAYEAGTLAAPDLVPTAFTAGKQGNRVNVSDTVENQGDAAAGAFTVAYYLSTDTTYDPGTDIPLAASSDGSGTCTRAVSALNPGQTSSVAGKTCYKPANTVSGTRYYVLAVNDAADQVSESDETNNVWASNGQVWW